MARLLIVEDEHDVAVMLKFMLEKAGHSAALAGNGVEALAALGVDPADPSKTPPDLIILDMMMPVMDGAQVCARLRADPRAQGIPVVLLTAKGGPPESRPSGGNVAAYLSKPFDPAALREVLAGILRGKA